MKSAAVLKILKAITWRHSTHHSKDGRRPEAEMAVKDHYSDKNLDALGVEKAEVKSTFHDGDGHKKQHVTVDFLTACGKHVTTQHVYGEKDN